MDKKKLPEADICDKFIRPAMERAGWDGMTQMFREFPLRAGRVVVRGCTARRDAGTVLRADYALFFKPNIPLAVVEAKDNSHAVGAGMGQAIQYAELLNVPFNFASNGDGFVFRDATLATGVLEQNLALDEFPSPQALRERYCAWKGWTPEVRHVTEFGYGPGKTPRYYQMTPRLAAQVGRYAHARQFRRMRAALRTLRRVGRIYREVARQAERLSADAKAKFADLLARTGRILRQRPKDKHRLYALRAPEVECISLGLARLRPTSSASRSASPQP